jgi:long-chain fatty acid transport protein
VKSPDLAQPRIGLPDTSRILLPRRWKDTVAVEGTLRYRAADRLRTWLTLGYRSAASPDSTIDVASPDGDRLVANLGANYALTPKLGLIVEGKLHSILPREVVGSENDLGNGRYRLNLFALGLHAAYAF